MTAIMVSAVVVLVGRGLTAWQRADGRLQELFRAEKAFQRLAEDLRNSVAVADSPFLGEGGELGFVRVESAQQLALIGYRVEERAGTKLLIRERREYPPSEDRPPEVSVLLDPLRAFSLAYPVLREGEAPRELEWQSNWPNAEGSKNVPEMVRVRVEFDDPKGGARSWTRVVWVPQGSLGVPSS